MGFIFPSNVIMQYIWRPAGFVASKIWRL